jgi:hypothetical protein
MKRLVYSPSVKAWVKTDTGTVDLSPYIVSCRIDRKIDDVSMAEIEFRNPRVNDNGKPRFMFTERDTGGKILPVFHPMDPITISMERIGGKPIQVFTGYCDSTPDVQLFPGTAKISASCTLKRLKHTWWDPSLPFVEDFLKEYGWELNPANGQVQKHDAIQLDNQKLSKSVNLNDGSIGNLLYAVLNEIGGWDDSNIYIQPLPSGITSMIAKMYEDMMDENAKVNQEISEFFSNLVGSGSFGTASAGDGSTGGDNGADAATTGPVAGKKDIVNTIRTISTQQGVPPEFVLAVAIVETDLDVHSADGGKYTGWFQWGSSQSYVGRPLLDMSKRYDLGYATAQFCKAAKARSKWKNTSYAAWARATQLNPSSVNGVLSPDLGPYAANPTGNARYGDVMFPGFVAEAKRLLNQYK